MSQNWIISLNAWGATLGPTLIRTSLQGGAFILAIWVICRLFKGLPAAGKSWLWWIASLQMLIRLVAISPLALPILPAHEGDQAPATHMSQPAISDAGSTATSSNFSTAVLTQPSFPVSSETQPQRLLGITLTQAPKAHLSLVAVASFFWVLGVLTCLAISIRRLAGTRRLLRNATPIESGPVYELVQEFSIDYRISSPRLLESPDALCPLLAGWARPAIVLPPQKASSLTEPQVRMAIAHEIAHLRRKDLWFGIIPAITQSLFYFHPLAWLAAHEGAAAREAACDSDALRMSGSSPAEYARLLIDSAQSRSSMAVLGTAFGYRLIQRRISMLKTLTSANAHRYRSASTFVIALAAVCALPWTVTAQASNSKKSDAAKQSPSKHTHKSAHPTKVAKVKASAAKVRGGVPPNPLAFKDFREGAARIAEPPYPGGLPARTVSPAPPRPALPPARITAENGQVRFGVAPISAIAPFPASRASLPPVRAANAPRSQVAQVADVPMQTSPATEAAPRANVTVGENGRLRIVLDKADIHEALKSIFKAYKLNYVIKSEVLTDTVTCSLEGIDVDFALQTILSSVKQPLTFRVEGSVYTIMVNK